MALELLSGPHTIVDINNDDANVALLAGYNCEWVDPVGLVAEVSVYGLYLVQMDGSACLISEFGNFTTHGLSLINASETDPLVGDRWYSYHDWVSTGPGKEREMNRVTRSVGRVLNANGATKIANHYAKLSDRYLSVVGSMVKTFTTDASETTTERSIPGLSNAQNMSWAREPERLWIGSTGGLVVQYDHVAKVEAGPIYSIGMSCSGIWYSKKHDVFISLHNAGSGVWQTRVWARTVKPASISAPVAESTLAAGKVVSLKCRVLGSLSEVCEDEVVTWELTGPGSLSPLLSKTDAQGWARTKYTVPLSASGSADIAVEVST
jgi:hypothetical protein